MIKLAAMSSIFLGRPGPACKGVEPAKSRHFKGPGKAGPQPERHAMLFKRMYCWAGLDHAASHIGQRTFATSLIEHGADIKALSTLMDHAAVAMTAHYVEDNPIRLRRMCEDVQLGIWPGITWEMGLSAVLVYDDGIVALAIDDAGPALSALTNDLLLACYGPRFTVALQTQLESANGPLKEGFEITVHDGEPGRQEPCQDEWW